MMASGPRQLLHLPLQLRGVVGQRIDLRLRNRVAELGITPVSRNFRGVAPHRHRTARFWRVEEPRHGGCPAAHAGVADQLEIETWNSAVTL